MLNFGLVVNIPLSARVAGYQRSVIAMPATFQQRDGMQTTALMISISTIQKLSGQLSGTA